MGEHSLICMSLRVPCQASEQAQSPAYAGSSSHMCSPSALVLLASYPLSTLPSLNQFHSATDPTDISIAPHSSTSIVGSLLLIMTIIPPAITLIPIHDSGLHQLSASMTATNKHLSKLELLWQSSYHYFLFC